MRGTAVPSPHLLFTSPLLRCLVVVALAFMCSLPALAAPAAMESYEQSKYPTWQSDLVAGVAKDVLPDATDAEREKVAREILAFFHVVYHPTSSHHFENNVAVTRRFRGRIEEACRRFVVPTAMAEAIITWENSGSASATSYAACVGLGQLSRGAVARAHIYFQDLSLRGDRMMAFIYDLGAWMMGRWLGVDYPPVQQVQSFARRLRTAGAGTDLGREHAAVARAAGVRDERMVPDCNIEDSVLFMRYLLDLYGDRIDLAISAYHNGVRNTDDLLRDWLRRHGGAPPPSNKDRQPFLDALDRHRISYLTLWSDRRSREMLNGLRTMDGDPTTPANAHNALGDESDIYVWKTLAALAGMRAPPARLQALIERYQGGQDEVETAGFVPGRLVTLPGGVRVVPEMQSYVRSLHRRYTARTGKPCPLRFTVVHDGAVHRSGLAIDVVGGNRVLESLITEDWFFDLVYRKRLPSGHLHVCLNPRFAATWESDAPPGRTSARK